MFVQAHEQMRVNIVSDETRHPLYQHLQRGHQWKPLHYLGISIGHPFEGPGICGHCIRFIPTNERVLSLSMLTKPAGPRAKGVFRLRRLFQRRFLTRHGTTHRKSHRRSEVENSLDTDVVRSLDEHRPAS